MKAKHTPTPWKQGDERGANWTKILSSSGHRPIAKICSIHAKGNREKDDFTIEQANAEHIVRCVNSHDVLVKALKHIQGRIDTELVMFGRIDKEDVRALYGIAEQALKDAEE